MHYIFYIKLWTQGPFIYLLDEFWSAPKKYPQKQQNILTFELAQK